jgi:hypothetical protein
VENDWDDYVDYNQEVQENEEKTDEATQQATQEEVSKLIDDAKDIINDPRDTVIQVGPGYSYSDGARVEGSATLAIDITHWDVDILTTYGVGGGTPSAGVAVSVGVSKSEGGISGLTGDGTNIGASHGYGADYSYSSSSNGVAISVSADSADITSEAHKSHTETYSLKETVKDAVESDINKFKQDAQDAYNNLIEKGLGQ